MPGELFVRSGFEKLIRWVSRTRSPTVEMTGCGQAPFDISGEWLFSAESTHHPDPLAPGAPFGRGDRTLGLYLLRVFLLLNHVTLLIFALLFPSRLSFCLFCPRSQQRLERIGKSNDNNVQFDL